MEQGVTLNVLAGFLRSETEDAAAIFQCECLIRAESAQVKDNEQVALLAEHLLRGIVFSKNRSLVNRRTE